ncbi:MAG TPA: hypothetical protein VHT52_22535 [Stellaceae bacterium]|nr:hypothetical protein [Stellaceae bacterium]
MIVRTYHCPACNHRIEVTLTAEEWDSPPPSCEACDRREMNQEFKPPAIGGSVRSRAAAITESIIANDYGVANFQSDRRLGGTPKVRYKDQTASVLPSDWQAAGHKAMLETAIGIGKQTRRQFGMDGLDMLKRNIGSGAQPDLIEASKRRAIKVW